jgi:predicted TIM-barrel fold metal-dependent hydrolase
MTQPHDDDHSAADLPKEPSLKDAPMSANPGAPKKPASKRRRPEPRNRREHQERIGEAPSLKDALLPRNHVPNPGATLPTENSAATVTPQISATANPPRVNTEKVIPAIVCVAVVLGIALISFVGRMNHSPVKGPKGELGSTPNSAEPAPEQGAALTDWEDPGPMSFAEMQKQHKIIDVHEHIESLAEAPLFLKAMDQLGIQKICLMGSSEFTLTLNEALGFTGYDENNEELIKIVNAYPGRFEAWPTLSPQDPNNLKKIQDLVARGATGVKLYTGHGYVTKKHEYMFHPVAMDAPVMFPFYAWCQENYIPIVLHVNPFSEKKGFAEEFVAVLTRFPDLKVVAPHFILSTIKSNRLRELLDTFPNLYTDVSFGDYFMKDRLTYISKEPGKFKKIFKDYPDRFMFAADLVMIKGRADNWAPIQYQAYLDMLTKDTYTSPAIPGVTLNGLNLSDELLSRILFRNYEAFRKLRPVNTKQRGEIDWKLMSVDPVDRKPGEAFPPASKGSGSGE